MHPSYSYVQIPPLLIHRQPIRIPIIVVELIQRQSCYLAACLRLYHRYVVRKSLAVLCLAHRYPVLRTFIGHHHILPIGCIHNIPQVRTLPDYPLLRYLTTGYINKIHTPVYRTNRVVDYCQCLAVRRYVQCPWTVITREDRPGLLHPARVDHVYRVPHVPRTRYIGRLPILRYLYPTRPVPYLDLLDYLLLRYVYHRYAVTLGIADIQKCIVRRGRRRLRLYTYRHLAYHLLRPGIHKRHTMP